MKKVVLSILAFFVVIRSFAATPDSLVNLANKYYVNNDFQKSADTYQEINGMGYFSPELYYNLGNSFYKLNNYAKAILYYEKALLLNPADNDIKHNLELANAHILDKIDVIPEFFLKKWVNNLVNTYSSNTWAIVSMISFSLFIILLLLYLLSGKMIVKQTAFFCFILAFFVSAFTFYFSAKKKKIYFEKNAAIVMAPSVTAKSSPNEYGTDLFILHEGTKVEIVDSIGTWNEIKISNGSKAWIESEAVEKI